MKKRILVVLTCMLVFGCSQDEVFEELEVENIDTISSSATIETENVINSSIRETLSLVLFQCDPDWEAPISDSFSIGASIIQIHYSSDLTLEEIHCIRQEYFVSYPGLSMAILQSNNPYHDTWVARGIRTGGVSVAQTVEDEADEDDRVCRGSTCD